ncbi:MAG: hypothetical protein HYU83_06515 [Chloroflexi bacterium]|nr:hypothetical protein [Chloroflexota bacterium]
MLDPQVQISIIDLAADWVESLELTAKTPEAVIKLKAERFDQAYQDLVKTVLSSVAEETSPAKGRVRIF